MSNYIHYIDFNAIKLGDLANGLGDYQCASENYTRALQRLKRYQGDQMQPMFMAKELTEKINDLNSRTGTSKRIFYYATWNLTKTSFVKGSQCGKYLYLDKHKKGEKTPYSAATVNLFNKGRLFEEAVRSTEFPNGIDIKEVVGSFAYFNSYTNYLINLGVSMTLYEATIIEDGLMVMCDILTNDSDGNIDIYEIKLNSEINDAILNDLAIQYYVCKKRFGSRLRSFNLILRISDTEWSITHMNDDLEPKLDDVQKKISKYHQILSGKEPDIAMGNHCHSPYKCEFVSYCEKIATIQI